MKGAKTVRNRPAADPSVDLLRRFRPFRWYWALIAVLPVAWLADRLGFGRAFAVSLLLSCFAPLLLVVMPLRSVALAAIIGGVMLVAGIGLGNANVYSLTLRQTVIPPSLLARSGGAYRQVMYGSIPIGSALAGVVGELVGTRAGGAGRGGRPGPVRAADVHPADPLAPRPAGAG